MKILYIFYSAAACHSAFLGQQISMPPTHPTPLSEPPKKMKKDQSWNGKKKNTVDLKFDFSIGCILQFSKKKLNKYCIFQIGNHNTFPEQLKKHPQLQQAEDYCPEKNKILNAITYNFKNLRSKLGVLTIFTLDSGKGKEN